MALSFTARYDLPRCEVELRILVVDDSVTTLDCLVEVVAKLPGVEHVHKVAAPLEAIRAIYSGWPDAVILDANVSRGSGPRILEAVRTGGTRILSVVLTADATQEYREACLRAGADFFFDRSREFQSAVDVIARLALGDAHGVELPSCWTCFDQLPIPSWLYDVDTFAFRAVNHAAVVRYGYSADEFLAMTVADIQLCEARPGIASERHFGPFQISGRRRHRDKDGALLYVEVAVTPLSHDGGRLGVALAYDVSDHVAAEAALRASETRYRELGQRLGQRMQAIGGLSGAVARDLTNTVTVIMGRTQQMINSLPRDHPALSDAVAILEASGVLASELRQFLDPDQATTTGSGDTPYFIPPPSDSR
jgi:PAS domain S-box-containing protein